MSAYKNKLEDPITPGLTFSPASLLMTISCFSRKEMLLNIFAGMPIKEERKI